MGRESGRFRLSLRLGYEVVLGMGKVVGCEWVVWGWYGLKKKKKSFPWNTESFLHKTDLVSTIPANPLKLALNESALGHDLWAVSS
ncbi:hypothetical protein M0802_005884 [Mischocyttarus mexicanus]|nr:hypothetical protein M0802_005884 [Mischocyttarus mexicanus]